MILPMAYQVAAAAGRADALPPDRLRAALRDNTGLEVHQPGVAERGALRAADTMRIVTNVAGRPCADDVLAVLFEAARHVPKDAGPVVAFVAVNPVAPICKNVVA